MIVCDHTFGLVSIACETNMLDIFRVNFEKHTTDACRSQTSITPASLQTLTVGYLLPQLVDCDLFLPYFFQIYLK